MSKESSALTSGKTQKKSSSPRGDIRSIAKTAGVSISTVSRVINASKPVSNELKKRVLAVIEKEKYVPNFTARSLVHQRTSTIGIAIPIVSPEFHMKILSGADGYLSERGYETVICPIGDDTEGQNRYIDLLARRVTDGLLLMHETGDSRVRSALRKERIPIVLGSVYFGKLRFPAVGIDDYAAAHDATRFLIGLGHRKIGLISLAEKSTAGAHRIQGYADALAEWNIEPATSRVTFGHYAYESGYYAVKALLERDPGVTAVFAASDEMAVGALHFLVKSGRSVPEEISLMGFDDVQVARFTNPSLTTVRQPITEIGRQSAELLLTLIQGDAIPKERINLPYEIVVRRSTGPPSTRKNLHLP
jgi:LacI family transcriptional regulator